jgi:hypothetical protein
VQNINNSAAAMLEQLTSAHSVVHVTIYIHVSYIYELAHCAMLAQLAHVCILLYFISLFIYIFSFLMNICIH